MWWARGDILGTFIHYTHSLDCQRSNSAIFHLASWPRIPDRLLTAHLRFLMRGAEACQGWVVQHWASQRSRARRRKYLTMCERVGIIPTPKSFLSSPRDSFLIESRCQGSGKKGNKARHYTKVSPEYHDWIRVKNESQGSFRCINFNR